mgnify:CR=1 FL=1
MGLILRYIRYPLIVTLCGFCQIVEKIRQKTLQYVQCITHQVHNWSSQDPSANFRYFLPNFGEKVRNMAKNWRNLASSENSWLDELYVPPVLKPVNLGHIWPKWPCPLRSLALLYSAYALIVTPLIDTFSLIDTLFWIIFYPPNWYVSLIDFLEIFLYPLFQIGYL